MDDLKSLPTSTLVEIIKIQKMVARAGLELDLVRQTIVDQIHTNFHYDATLIEMLEGDWLVFKNVAGPYAEKILGTKVNRHSSLSGLALKENTPFLCLDTETDPRVDREACRRIGARSMIVLPFGTPGGSAGVLKVMASRSEAITNDDVKVIALLAEVLADSLHNAEIAEERKREAVHSRENFLSIASHELKTPLTTLKLHAQMRLMNLERKNHEFFSLDRLRSHVVSENKQLDRIARLIDDMVDVTRISSGKLSIQKENFDLVIAIKEVIESLTERASGEKPEINILCPEPILGHWDRFRIDQIINNLISNALKYGAGKPVTVTASCDKDLARISVTDLGPGIAQQDQKRIFERFERGFTEREISGLGLGLFIAREITERHGGRILLESRPGHGSTFTVELPLSL
jgi:signal transduction histidine kinase